MPNLVTFGATEYMDGALTFAVLTELLFRGVPIRHQQRRSSTSRTRSLSPVEENADGPSDWGRRTDAQVRDFQAYPDITNNNAGSPSSRLLRLR